MNLENVVWYMRCKNYQCFYFFFPPSLEVNTMLEVCAVTLERAHWPRLRPLYKMGRIMMITGSGGFHHSLTIIKLSASHDKTHFSNSPPSIVMGGSPTQVEVENSIQLINCTKFEWTWVGSTSSFWKKKSDNKQTNYSINNNGACGFCIGKHTWSKGKAPEDPIAGFLGGWDKHRSVQTPGFFGRAVALAVAPGRLERLSGEAQG